MTDSNVGGALPSRPGGAGGRTRLRIGGTVVLAVVVTVAAIVAGAWALRGRDVAQTAALPFPAASGSLPAGAVTSAPETAAPASAAPASTVPSAAPSTAVPSAVPSAAPSTAVPSTGSSSAPGTTRIAVIDDTGSLVTLDENGGSRVSYPTHGAALGFPAWSPDGSRIAVVAQGTTDTAIDVFTVQRAGGAAGEPTVVYNSPDQPPFYLYWSPDSRHVSFLTSEPAGLALRVVPVDATVPSDGADTASIIRRGSPLYFEWVDTDRVLLHVGGGADAFMGQVGLDGVQRGTPVDATGNFRTASLSSDGRYIAYASSPTSTTAEIVVEGADASTRRRVPAFGAAAMLFDPKGDTLAMISADKPGTETVGFPIGPLRLIDPATGVVRTVLDRSVLAFFWAPDGRTIATLSLVAPGDAPVAAGGRPVLARQDLSDRQLAVTAAIEGADVDLAFIDVATGAVRGKRLVRIGEMFVGQLLPYFDQYALSHRIWSSDSASLLLPLVQPSGIDQLVIVPADGSDPRPVTGGTKGFWSP